MPDEPHVGDEEGAEIALVGRQVPHTGHLARAAARKEVTGTSRESDGNEQREWRERAGGAPRDGAARRGAFAHGAHLVVHLLVGQQDERLVLDDRAAQLQVAVEPRRVVGTVDGLHGREEPRRLPHQVGEDKLEARVVELGHHVQRLTPEERGRAQRPCWRRPHKVLQAQPAAKALTGSARARLRVAS
eukprot:6826565-Prymnesium_polylepis.1